MKIDQQAFKQCLSVLRSNGFKELPSFYGVAYDGAHKMHGDVHINKDTVGYHISDDSLRLLARLQALEPMHRNARK